MNPLGPGAVAALEAARARPPDLIISDVMMPRLDGFGLIRELRSDPALGTIPVMVLSARAGSSKCSAGRSTLDRETKAGWESASRSHAGWPRCTVVPSRLAAKARAGAASSSFVSRSSRGRSGPKARGPW